MKNFRKKKGQALVEFAIILPLLLLIAMGIVEFGMMLNSYLTIRNESREGARAGIVGSSSQEIESLIISSSPNLDSDELKIYVTPLDVDRKSGETLTVSVSYNYRIIVPFVSSLFDGDVELNAQTSMRVE